MQGGGGSVGASVKWYDGEGRARQGFGGGGQVGGGLSRSEGGGGVDDSSVAFSLSVSRN